MILQALTKYYEILADDEKSDIPKIGCSKAKVSYALNISREGKLLNLIPLKIEEKRGKKVVEISRLMDVPEQIVKTSGVASNFLCENSSYVFGFDKNGISKRTRQCFEAFKKLHMEILKPVKCDEAKAVINFVNNWDVDTATLHPALAPYIDDIVSGANFVFRLSGSGFIHENAEIKEAWMSYKNSREQGVVMQCLVTGKKSPIARIHPSIKGVKNAQSSGAAIVSFNLRAYESYGYDNLRGLNAPISEYAAFAYTTVLNYLLTDASHKILLGDTTVVYWAQSPNKIYQDAMSLFIEPDEKKLSAIKDDDTAAMEIRAIFEKIVKGRPIGDLSDVFDRETRFYILGISPNAARLSIRFFLEDSFGGFIEKMGKHYRDMQIEKQYENDKEIFSVSRLLRETVSPKSKDKDANPLLSGAVYRAVITGGKYPAFLYQSVMLRIRAEKDINYYKAAIIKGYLIRNKKDKFKEVLTMSLNENSENCAYVLGRLFALLESLQQDANKGINTTIKDRYFSSACASPASVFPALFRLAQNHISKSEYGYIKDKKIEEVLAKLDIEENPIPAHLNLEEQGIFVLGYYHQRNALYTSNKDKEDTK
ncbi:MAG: type I-C CRISPR-associated protein Cas8c/Csd1 [Clostridia bacterium]|nr:type I-C CRISPR-associated protein Cas8c/Csd1 [Clostridia bacterium]